MHNEENEPAAKRCLRCGNVIGIAAGVCDACGFSFHATESQIIADEGRRDLIDENGLPISPLDAYDRMTDGTTKRCPVCEKMVQIDAQFCDHCQWEFTYYRCYRCMHLFHPTDKVHIQGDRLICPNCNIDLKSQDREKHVSSNVKPVIAAIGVTLVFSILYVYFAWGEFIPNDAPGIASVLIIVVTAIGLIYGYLKWRRSNSYIPLMGIR
jgi:hypothetical protein